LVFASCHVYFFFLKFCNSLKPSLTFYVCCCTQAEGQFKVIRGYVIIAVIYLPPPPPPPGRGAEHCDQHVCLCVCMHLSVCPWAYLWNRWTNRHKIFCADVLWPWLDPPLVALWYVMYFRFYGWRHVLPQWAVWH